MAKKRPEFDWEERPQRGTRYDWTLWTNGETWEIRKGEDYEISTENMRVNLHDQARQRNLKARTRKVSGEKKGHRWEGLVFQFRPPDAES